MWRRDREKLMISDIVILILGMSDIEQESIQYMHYLSKYSTVL